MARKPLFFVGNQVRAERGITIGSLVREWTPDEGEIDDLSAYIQVEATLDGRPIRLGTVIGVPESQQGECRAAGSGVRPYLSVWWADASDWQDVPRARLEEVKDALRSAAPRLWTETLNAREGAASEVWTFEGYWNVVLGDCRSAKDVVREFALDPSDRCGLDEWLGFAEAESWVIGRLGGPGSRVPGTWGDFHERALDALCAVEVQS